MAVYTEKWPISYALNTITELELTTTQNVQNNYTTVSYVVRVKRLRLANGNGNYNDNWTPASGGSYTTLVIDGKTILNDYRSNWTTLSNNPEETAVVASGSTNVYHNANGTKNITFSLTLRPNVSSISTMPNRVITGNFDATTIPRASSFTLADTLTSGSNYTMTITRASTAFTHKVVRVIGGVEVAIDDNASTSATINIPHSVFNNYPSSNSVTATIIVRTFSGSTQIGSASKTVRVNLTSSAIPTVTGLSVGNSNSGPMGSNQFIRGISRLTLTASSDNGSYSSTISAYEFRYKRASGTYQGEVSTTSKSYQYAAFTFPNSGSEVLDVAVRVKDSRGRYSAWKETASAIRVHYYQAPTIGSITVRRVGSNNTTLQVTRNYVVTSLLEGGATQKNTASLKFQTKVLGGANPTTFNTGATSTTMTLTNSNANLNGTFSASSSYEVRAVLSDALNTVYGSWVTVGTEFVPLDFSSKGVGVGKIHSDGSADLEVGSGGIRSDGDVTFNKKQWARVYTGDLNDIDRTWVMTNVGSTNLPPGSHYWYVKTIWYNENNRSQFAIGYNHNRMAQRHIANTTTWSPWVEVLTGPDIKVGNNTISNNNQVTRITTPHGNVDIGPVNQYHAHIYTDRPSFYFNKDILVNGTKLATVTDVNNATPFTKGSNTNGTWIKFSDGTIIAERKITVTYTHNQKIPNFAYNMPVSMPTDCYVGVSLRSAYTANSEAEIDIYDNFDFLVVGKRGNQWIMKPNLFNRFGSVSYGANNGNWFNTKAGTTYTMHLTFTAIGVV